MIDRELIKRAIAEDLAGGVDITSMATLSAEAKISAQFIARKDGVIAGIDAWKDAGLAVEINEEPDWDSGTIFGTGTSGIDKFRESIYKIDDFQRPAQKLNHVL